MDGTCVNVGCTPKSFTATLRTMAKALKTRTALAGNVPHPPSTGKHLKPIAPRRSSGLTVFTTICLTAQKSKLPPKRSPAYYLWAVLIARIYEVFPLLCPLCGGQMRIIAFITHSVGIRHILDHIGVEAEPPRISSARGPPLWDDCDAYAQMGEDGQIEPDWYLAGQSAPDHEVDQRVNW
jgi:hypothetical protein